MFLQSNVVRATVLHKLGANHDRFGRHDKQIVDLIETNTRLHKERDLLNQDIVGLIAKVHRGR